ncbi:serine hydrolase [Altererythrobacter aurantiacus]|uniref:Serine hydrolase n=1 Tax=Parapontixanthobacter aurantiacus TaxID=1463599 RepID=A0A844ZCK1_9SPHN|nr:serine hydrolase domain-containing protein [Parapontixanthobacter aurantiacus]MXO85002.1 serine hydrolase [Parapontixanthobacter aurantiacus]
MAVETPSCSRRAILSGALGSTALLFAQSLSAKEQAFLVGTFGIAVNADGVTRLELLEENGLDLSPELRWHLGSNTKAMTALLYAVCVERGEADWGATLAELFPDIALHADLRDASVEQLMAHVAGLSDRGIDATWLNTRRADDAPLPDQRRTFTEEWLKRAPSHERGTFAYANANFIVLGAAIERLLGMSWEEAMTNMVFKPLGLSSAGFGAPLQEGLWGRQAYFGTSLPLDPTGIADNPAAFGPAGTVHMSPLDYGRFLSLFLREGAPLVQPETLRHLLTPPSPDLTYAGGWALASFGQDRLPVLLHDGSNTFWYARAIVDRNSGLAFAAGANDGGDQGRERVDQAIKSLSSAA